MSKKNIYEVFDDFKAAKTKQERIDVLKQNDTFALRNVLIGAMHPGVEFLVKKIPDFKREEVPAGMAYNHMTEALSKIYLFMKNNPRTPPGLTEKRRDELLLQLLEGLEPKEADVYVGILQKDLKVPYLTANLVNEAFDNLLPKP